MARIGLPMKPLKVGIDARLAGSETGGVRQVLMGLAHGLSQLRDGPEEYLFLVYRERCHHDWLEPFLSGPARLVPGASPARGARDGGSRPRATALRRVRRLLRAAGRPRIPRSDGTLERCDADVVHLALPMGFLTELPTVYHPHDLLHRHFPSHFDLGTRLRRDRTRRILCRRAAAVVAMTEWGREDLIRSYGLPPAKVHAVPWASALRVYGGGPGAESAGELARRLNLPPAFALYPANTYEHKNHRRLLAAVARLRESRGLEIPLLLTGRRGGAHESVLELAAGLGLTDLVRHLGFVSQQELQLLYRRCRLVVFPSLFEGWGLPVSEALDAGVPLACARATCLPEIAGEAALFFDPESVAEIGDCLARLWTDARLRAELAERAAERGRRYRWIDTAERLRELYRRAARDRSLKP